MKVIDAGFASNFAELFEDEVTCPAEYPFAYYHGLFCCHYKREKFNPKHNSACDNGELTFYSSCCYKNAFKRCPDGRCSGLAQFYDY